ncbi:DNA cytosine methyltransferase [Agrobacterium pusense]|uniref:DNA cytosine methyltransferase n=1 Tax=Agrobacterium pusense TaxID=648995 RepID=UPI0010BEAEA9|nr:DNA cytosine methyltransferase [Agrobacterium pusense]QCL83329.1 DNA cytosine methyltransferase [Agrobacterium pusense]
MERAELNDGIFRDAFTEELPTDYAPNPGVPDGSIKTAISLFSGGGGLDIGIEAAGFRTLACIEKDANACETLEYNQSRYFSHADVINASVTDVDVKALMGKLGIRKGELDLLFGGPPCQTFSQIGKKDGLGDERGRLLFAMVDYAKALMPKAIVIENVKGLKSARSVDGTPGGIVMDLTRQLEKLGYLVSSKVLDSSLYGVAQKRQRLFIVAIKREFGTFEFPAPTVDKHRVTTVGEVISALPAHVRKGMAPLHENHIDVTPDGDIRRISYVVEGLHLAKMADAPPEIKGRLGPKDTTKFLRLSRTKPSNTLRCGEIFFHPLEDRYLTPREYMRIHGFPDDYVLRGPIRGRSGTVKNLDQHRLVANSVPPAVGRAVGLAVLSQITR